MSKMSNEYLMSIEDEADLFERIKSGNWQRSEDATKILMKAYLSLVESVAKQYADLDLGMIASPILSLTDLINEGYMGLLNAAHDFDTSCGIRFQRLAGWSIHQAILKALADSMDSQRLYKIDFKRQVQRTRFRLEKELKRRPTFEEIAEAEDKSVEAIKSTMNLYRHFDDDAKQMERKGGIISSDREDFFGMLSYEEIAEALDKSVEEIKRMFLHINFDHPNYRTSINPPTLVEIAETLDKSVEDVKSMFTRRDLR
jgi:RNA polymerase sigma factor (sigma-70 family)